MSEPAMFCQDCQESTSGHCWQHPLIAGGMTTSEYVAGSFKALNDRIADLERQLAEARELYDIAVKQNVEKLDAGITKRWMDAEIEVGRERAAREQAESERDALREALERLDRGFVLAERVLGATKDLVPIRHHDDVAGETMEKWQRLTDAVWESDDYNRINNPIIDRAIADTEAAAQARDDRLRREGREQALELLYVSLEERGWPDASQTMRGIYGPKRGVGEP